MNTRHTQKGGVFGATLLISGCCIGAGMLALPITTGIAGFIPSLLSFVLGWLFMLSTGLLVLEVNLWLGQGVSLISMADRTLGKIGKSISWITFLFLFYSLLVAFITASGNIIIDATFAITGFTMPEFAGFVCAASFYAAIIYFGTRVVDQCNKLFILGLVISYIMLVIFGLKHVDNELLSLASWKNSFFILPVTLISFGFHQLVPSLTDYLKGDAKALKTSLIIGSTIPFFMYVLWQYIVLGIVPLNGSGGIYEAMQKGFSATQTLNKTIGSTGASIAGQYFAAFALTSTVISVALGFIDFLADGLQVKKTKKGMLFLCSLVLCPPLIISLTYPGAFLTALNIAGGFGTTLLFGILPPLMVWVIRYKMGAKTPRCLPGGRIVLFFIILFAIGVMFFEILQEMGYSPIPMEVENQI